MKNYSILFINLVTLGAIAGCSFTTISIPNDKKSISKKQTPSLSPRAEFVNARTFVSAEKSIAKNRFSANKQPSPRFRITTKRKLARTLKISSKAIPEKRNQTQEIKFSQFRLRLVDAIKRRDANFIRSIINADTQWSYGGTLDIESYNINDKQSLFWVYIEKAISLGCAIDSETDTGVWICPDITQLKQSIQPDNQPLGNLAILGQKVNIRDRPQTNSKVVAVLSHEYVAFDLDTFNGLPLSQQKDLQEKVITGWTPVMLKNGDRGWVKNRYIYNQETDYRVGFTVAEGKWQLRYFLPGNGN